MKSPLLLVNDQRLPEFTFRAIVLTINDQQKLPFLVNCAQLWVYAFYVLTEPHDMVFISQAANFHT